MKKVTEYRRLKSSIVLSEKSSKYLYLGETGNGYPDITLLEPIAEVLSVSVTELISGNAVKNGNVSANMLKTNFYVCPVCGNVIQATGEAVINCHGVLLHPFTPEKADENHKLNIETVEDEYFVSIDHPMTKTHYISFAAAVSSDRIQTVKFYPEGNAETRFKINSVKRIYFFCNKDGLYYEDIVRKSRK